MELTTGYKQTEVGVIPEDWVLLPLNGHVDLVSGQHILAADYNEDEIGMPYLTGPSDFVGYYSTVTKWTTSPKTIAIEGDILITVKGSGAGSLFVLDIPKAAISRQLMAIRSKNISERYLQYLLHTKRDYLSVRATGNLIPGLSRVDILSLVVPLPPLPEQRAIASALSDADALIESLDHLIAKKRLIKEGAMGELLRPKDGWRATKLKSLGVFLKGSGVRKDEATSGDVPCVRYGEIYTKHNDYIKQFYSWISKDVAATAQLLKYGDLLFAGSGETKEDIGKCVAFVDDLEAYAGGDIVILRTENSSPIFLGYYLNTSPIKRQKSSKGQGDAVVHIGAAALGDIDITIPPLPEQTAIASILSDMDAEIGVLEARLEKARRIREGMMGELLTGRIRLI